MLSAVSSKSREKNNWEQKNKKLKEQK